MNYLKLQINGVLGFWGRVRPGRHPAGGLVRIGRAFLGRGHPFRAQRAGAEGAAGGGLEDDQGQCDE